MTDKWAEHKQKFCGCKDASRLNSCQGRNNCELPEGHPERVSATRAAPRQPEGEGLEVVGWVDDIGTFIVKKTGKRAVCSEPFVDDDLCRLSDAKRAIAELRAKLDDARSARDAYGQNAISLQAERDTLRQQRDKLKRLLARACLDISDSDLIQRIDAALAEVKL